MESGWELVRTLDWRGWFGKGAAVSPPAGRCRQPELVVEKLSDSDYIGGPWRLTGGWAGEERKASGGAAGWGDDVSH